MNSNVDRNRLILFLSGPFSNWDVIPTCQSGGSILRRNVGGFSPTALLDDGDYNAVMSHSTFQVSPWT